MSSIFYRSEPSSCYCILAVKNKRNERVQKFLPVHGVVARIELHLIDSPRPAHWLTSCWRFLLAIRYVLTFDTRSLFHSALLATDSKGCGGGFPILSRSKKWRPSTWRGYLLSYWPKKSWFDSFRMFLSTWFSHENKNWLTRSSFLRLARFGLYFLWYIFGFFTWSSISSTTANHGLRSPAASRCVMESIAIRGLSWLRKKMLLIKR